MKYADISHYHPVSDWDKVKENCPFLISKATQGTSFIDSTLDRFIKGCEANKIPYWLYTYLNKGNEKAQAEFLVKTCREKVGSCFVGYILDVEAGNAAADVQEALNYISSLGVKTMIYTGYSNYDTYKDVIANRPNDCAWWEARYGKNNGTYSDKYPCHEGVDLHQFTSNGECLGITGRCDLNRIVQRSEAWYTTPAQIQSAAKPATTPSGTTLELVAATMKDTYGKGDARKNALGTRYEEVQSMINHIAIASVDSLVAETKTGKYGDGDIRKTVLGIRYQEVQDRINATSTSVKKIVAGRKVILNKAKLYASATAKTASGTKSGTYYLWDDEVTNGRIRITNACNRVGVSGQITGWVSTEDI